MQRLIALLKLQYLCSTIATRRHYGVILRENEVRVSSHCASK
jgi:hypothetical protein